MSEVALKNLSLKEEFLSKFSERCGIRKDTLFRGLRVTYDYTQHERIDAVLLTSWKVHLFEVVTWTGRYQKENDSTWMRQERVEGVPITSSPSSSTTSSSPNGTDNSIVTLMSTRVTNPVLVGQKKMKALKQYIESKMGPTRSSDYEYWVLFIKEECILSEDCLSHPNIVPYSQLDEFLGNTFKKSWSRWFAEWYPMWPVWIRSYSRLKETLDSIPTWDVVHLKSGGKLYGELKACLGVPYDRQTNSDITFTVTKAGYLIGHDGVIANVLQRKSKSVFTVTLEVTSSLDFICVDADTPTSIKLSDINKVCISRPWQ